MKLHKSFGYGDDITYEYQLNVGTPDDEHPDDPFYVRLYVEFLSEDFDQPFQANQVIEVSAGSEEEIQEDYNLNFYE